MFPGQRAFLQNRIVKRPAMPNATNVIPAGNGVDVHVAFAVGADVVTVVSILVTVVAGGFVVEILVVVAIGVAVPVGCAVGWSATNVIFVGPEIVTPSLSP
jgi:hypothetical protein